MTQGQIAYYDTLTPWLQRARYAWLKKSKDECRNLVNDSAREDLLARGLNWRNTLFSGGHSRESEPPIIAKLARLYSNPNGRDLPARNLDPATWINETRSQIQNLVIRHGLASNSIRAAINGGYSFLRVECTACQQSAWIDVTKVRRPRETWIWQLEGSLACSLCRERSKFPPRTKIEMLCESDRQTGPGRFEERD